MSDWIMVYFAGFIGTSAVFGWLRDPNGDHLLQSTISCAMWPLTMLFVAVAALANAIKDGRS